MCMTMWFQNQRQFNKHIYGVPLWPKFTCTKTFLQETSALQVLGPCLHDPCKFMVMSQNGVTNGEIHSKNNLVIETIIEAKIEQI